MFRKLVEILATLSTVVGEMKNTQIKYLEMKTTMSEVKTTLVNLENKGEKINEHKDIPIEISQMKYTEKNGQKNKQHQQTVGQLQVAKSTRNWR